MLDAEVKKLEDEIKDVFFVKEPRMVRHSAYNHTDKFEHYHRELVNLLPWIGPHITKHSGP